MSDDTELGGVITFSDSIADAEAPLPIPEGVFPAEVRDVKFKVRNSGKRGLDVYFHIKPEDYPASFPVTEAPDGVTLVFRRLSVEDTKQNRYNLKRFLQNIGAPPVGATLDEETLASWKGLETKIVIKHGEWEGNVRPEIERIVAAA